MPTTLDWLGTGGGRFTPTLHGDFLGLREEDLPARAGVYLLVAHPDSAFRYPTGTSAVYYIGQARNLARRLLEHRKHALQARDNRALPLYWQRYEYAAAFGGTFTTVPTWSGMQPKNLEDHVLALFARRFHAFPVANGSGSWSKVDRVFSEGTDA